MNKNTNTNSHITNPLNPNINEIQSTLLLLYNSLKTKITKKTPSSSLSKTDNNTSLPSHYDCFTLINYIKECIDVLLQISLNEKIDDYIVIQTSRAAQQEYEPMLIKYESDIRGHIKAEHQLKLYIDNLQYEIEQHEKEKKKYEIIIDKYRKTNYDKEIKELKNEVFVLRKQNAILSDDIKKLKEINIQQELSINNLKNKIQLYENNTSNNNSHSNSSKPTRKNSSSAVSTNSGCCGNNNNNNNNNSSNTNYIPKRVIKSVTSQLTKRNKILSHSVSNSSSHNKNMNYINNNNNNSTSQLDRSLSKQNDNSSNSLIKNINLFNHNLSSSLSSYSNKKQSYSCNNHHRNRSVGNYNSKKNYDQIHLIRELLLKKESNNIIHKSSVHSKEKAPHYPHNKSISGGYIHMNVSHTKQQNANNSGNINNQSYGSINKQNKKCMIYNKHSNKKIASSLIINNSNNAFVNNINIITSSPKNG